MKNAARRLFICAGEDCLWQSVREAKRFSHKIDLPLPNIQLNGSWNHLPEIFEELSEVFCICRVVNFYEIMRPLLRHYEKDIIADDVVGCRKL